MKTGSLQTTSSFMHSSHHYVCEYVATRSFPINFSLCLIQKYMNKTRHVTYELPCAHDKRSQIDRQMRVSVLVAAQARWQFCSLRHTLRACAYVKHECLCNSLSIDVIPALIFFQILAFPSCSVPHCTPSFLLFHCASTIQLRCCF